MSPSGSTSARKAASRSCSEGPAASPTAVALPGLLARVKSLEPTLGRCDAGKGRPAEVDTAPISWRAGADLLEVPTDAKEKDALGTIPDPLFCFSSAALRIFSMYSLTSFLSNSSALACPMRPDIPLEEDRVEEDDDADEEELDVDAAPGEEVEEKLSWNICFTSSF